MGASGIQPLATDVRGQTSLGDDSQVPARGGRRKASEAAQLIMGVDVKDFLASNGINPQGEKKSVAVQKAKTTASAIFSLLTK